MKWLHILKKQNRPGRFIMSRILRDTGLWRFFQISKEGYSLRLHPASLALSLWVNDEDRDVDTEVVNTLLKPGDVYVDVGANIGQLVVVGGMAVGERGEVIAFEAHPKAAIYLRENVERNRLQNVKIAQAAVGNEFGWVAFSDVRSDDQNKVVEAGLKVPMVRLKPYLEKLGKRVKLLKIDVEGFEKYVLLGAGDALKEVDIIYFEALDSHYSNYGYEFREIFDILNSYGFSLGIITNNKFIPVNREDSFPHCCNVLATRDPDYLNKKFTHHEI